jgi:hypothetical protein
MSIVLLQYMIVIIINFGVIEWLFFLSYVLQLLSAM